MKEYIDKLIKREFREIISLSTVVLVGFTIIAILFVLENHRVSNLKSYFASTTDILSERVKILEADLATTSRELSQKLIDQQNRLGSFEDNIDDISDTVGDLEKLSKTDRELLQKYSKVYFLSDNFVPLKLSYIDKDYLEDPTKKLQFHGSALSYLENMIDAAKSKDIEIKIVSAYRSFGTQSDLKAGYTMIYGSGANAFSADQGYSEHQLGTAVDLTLAGMQPDLTISFENTTAYDWLSKNAYKYGFILSYPKDNKYYQYEPWHWRFVGKALATRLHREGISFSDMDQRQIDEYLVRIFD